MDRRRFTVSLGTLVGGGAAAVGTGAFSSVTASRNFDVEVSGDANAYLGLQPHPGPNGNYAEITSGDTLAVDFTSNNSNIGNGIAGGQGVNANAVSLVLDVFRVTNQGTQEVTVDVQPFAFLEFDGLPPNSLLAVLMIPALGPATLSPGDSQDYHMIAFSFEADGEPDVSVMDTLQIVAEEA